MGLVLGLVLAAILKFIDARTLKFIFTLVTVALFQRHLSKVCKSSERTYSVDIVWQLQFLWNALEHATVLSNFLPCYYNVRKRRLSPAIFIILRQTLY